MGELYLHTHSRRQDGKSPVVALIESAITDRADLNENNNGDGLRDPSTEEPIIETDVPDYDIHSLHFTNSNAKSVFVSCSPSN